VIEAGESAHLVGPRWLAAEFFAGIGLARVGLRRGGVEVDWSNDISATKSLLYRRFFGSDGNHAYVVRDLGELSRTDLPQNAHIAWASFPCTDLSVAGGRAGLHKGAASSTFWHFVKALSKLGSAKPPVVALENVTAFATSHSGRDIESAIRALNGLGYSIDVLSIDASHFVPQSRPRLFLVGLLDHAEVSGVVPTDHSARPSWLDSIFDNAELLTHRSGLPDLPARLTDGLEAYVEEIPANDSRWWSEERLDQYLGSLTELQAERLRVMRGAPYMTFRTAYRRMRDGVPRWEMRADGIAGCLRTSRGGSSKQAVISAGCGELRVRWMTPVEYANLMGAGDFSLAGVTDHHAYSGFGDAVCAPVVEWLTRNYLVPVLEARGGAILPAPTRIVADLETTTSRE
jgi:DNA (cytosine-5)-methyltransferase 1